MYYYFHMKMKSVFTVTSGNRSPGKRGMDRMTDGGLRRSCRINTYRDLVSRFWKVFPLLMLCFGCACFSFGLFSVVSVFCYSICLDQPVDETIFHWSHSIEFLVVLDIAISSHTRLNPVIMPWWDISAQSVTRFFHQVPSQLSHLIPWLPVQHPVQESFFHLATWIGYIKNHLGYSYWRLFSSYTPQCYLLLRLGFGCSAARRSNFFSITLGLRLHLQKLIVAHLVQKAPVFYEFDDWLPQRPNTCPYLSQL